MVQSNYIKKYNFHFLNIVKKYLLGIGDWGLGIGDWGLGDGGLGVGGGGQSQIPQPQTPTPKLTPPHTLL